MTERLGGLLILLILGWTIYYWLSPGEREIISGSAVETAALKTFTGRVSRVADGDSIEILYSGRQVRLRLYGVDAPELNQKHGPEAHKWLEDRILGEIVQGAVMDVDQYNREVAVIYLNKVPVNVDLVAAGQAWVYTHYCSISLCDQMKELQKEARVQKLGLWKDQEPIPPWRWRRDNPSR